MLQHKTELKWYKLKYLQFYTLLNNHSDRLFYRYFDRDSMPIKSIKGSSISVAEQLCSWQDMKLLYNRCSNQNGSISIYLYIRLLNQISFINSLDPSSAWYSVWFSRNIWFAKKTYTSAISRDNRITGSTPCCSDPDCSTYYQSLFGGRKWSRGPTLDPSWTKGLSHGG
jgi:hypothetical protein